MTPDTATRIDDQVVLVTGASRGIGQATAAWLKALGGDVFGTATSQDGADRISQDLGDGRGLVLDVTEVDAIQDTIRTINERAGAVTVLVNNAAITRDQLLMRLKDEDWDAVMNTNLRGLMQVTRACLRGMLKARSGRVVNVSSVVGYSGNPGQSNYAAAKAGVAGFTRSLAHEVGSRGITANVVAPGFIDTDMTRELDEGQRQRLKDGIPLGRLGTVEDVAAAIGFLVGPAGSYLTGQTLHVNGGMYMT
jgi:3-oxoacyl-[acyl-carrier protein] reductase